MHTDTIIYYDSHNRVIVMLKVIKLVVWINFWTTNFSWPFKFPWMANLSKLRTSPSKDQLGCMSLVSFDLNVKKKKPQGQVEHHVILYSQNNLAKTFRLSANSKRLKRLHSMERSHKVLKISSKFQKFSSA